MLGSNLLHSLQPRGGGDIRGDEGRVYTGRGGIYKREGRGGDNVEAERVGGSDAVAVPIAERGVPLHPIAKKDLGAGRQAGVGVPCASHPPHAPWFGFARGGSGAGPGALPLPLPLFRVPIKYALPPPDCGTASGATPLNCHYQHRYGFIS